MKKVNSIIIIAVALIAGFFLLKNKFSYKEGFESDSTFSWKTRVNKYCGYSIEHPSNWSIVEWPQHSCAGDTFIPPSKENPKKEKCKKGWKCSDDELIFTYLQILIRDSQGLSVEDYLKQDCYGYCDKMTVTKSSDKIGELETFKSVFKDHENEPSFYIKKDDKIYWFMILNPSEEPFSNVEEFTKNEEIFKHMIASFRFLN